MHLNTCSTCENWKKTREVHDADATGNYVYTFGICKTLFGIENRIQSLKTSGSFGCNNYDNYDNGWRGANESFDSRSPLGRRPCSKCGAVGDIREFHRSTAKKIKGPDHIDVCEECASKLNRNWHGCGCGG